MAKKSLAALLIVGIALMPVGLYANYFLGDQIGGAVPEVLLTIKDGAAEQIEDELWKIGNADALKRIMELAYEKLPKMINGSGAAKVINQTLDGVRENVYMAANYTTAANIINQTLQGLVDDGLIGLNIINATVTALVINETLDGVIENVELVAEATTAANIINQTLDGVHDYLIVNNVINATIASRLINQSLMATMFWNSTTLTIAMEEFFNNYTYVANYSSSIIMGISEFWNQTLPGFGNLSYTPTAQSRFLYGAGGLPGIITDLDMGMGMLGFMALYVNATDGLFNSMPPYGDIDDTTQQAILSGGYSATWTQISLLAGYIQNYLWNTIVAPTILGLYSMTPSQFAHFMVREFYFNDPDWTITTMGQAVLYPGGPNIQSISELWDSIYSTGNLSYPATAQSRILYGYSGLPGLLTDLVQGMGVLGFLELYQNATDGQNSYMTGYGFIDDTTQQGILAGGYGCSWSLLGYVAGYINNYMIPSLVPTAFLGQYSMTIPTYAHMTALEWFFNAPDWSTRTMGLAPINGVSEVMTLGTLNLTYTPTAQNRLLNGYGPLPGLITDLEMGMGVLGFMELYKNATDTQLSYMAGYGFIPDATQQGILSGGYNATWAQITYLSGYIKNYVWANVVYPVVVAQYGMTPLQLAHIMAREFYFNDPEWTTTTMGMAELYPGGPKIQGLSEYWDGIYSSGNLSYSPASQSNILYGAGGLPGIITDLVKGMGMIGFMTLYANATDGKLSYLTGYGFINDATEQAILAGGYGCTWQRIVYVVGYVNNYMVPNLAPTAFYGLYGMTMPTYAYITALDWFFNDEDWSTTTMGLAPINGVSEVRTLGTLNLSYTPTGQVRLLDGNGGLPGLNYEAGMGLGVIGILELYDNSTDGIPSFLKGYGYIPDATEQAILTYAYNCTWYQIANWSLYLSVYIYLNVVPVILQYPVSMGGYGTNNYNELVPMLVFDQWCNFSLTDGIALNLKLLEAKLPEDVYGLECNIPTLTNATCTALWVVDDDMSITNRDGQKTWYDAWDGGSNSDEFKDLKEHFGLTTTETQGIANWLYEGDNCFQQLALPTLFIYDQNVTIAEKAELLFLEQWADMTMDGDEEYPDGLPLAKDANGKDITGIELGEKSDIKLSTAKELWDEDNKLAFTNAQGIVKWYAAADKSSAAYKELQEEFDLDDDQMKLITDWLQTFKSSTLNDLAVSQGQANPGLIQNLTWGIVGIGAVLAVIGAILLKKRK